jgi:hypothetical protein
MTSRHGYQFSGRIRTPALRMYWENVEGRLVCRWIDCAELAGRAEPNEVEVNSPAGNDRRRDFLPRAA